MSAFETKVTKDYLMAKGIDESRIMTTHFGEVSPIAKNKTGTGSENPQGR